MNERIEVLNAETRLGIYKDIFGTHWSVSPLGFTPPWECFSQSWSSWRPIYNDYGPWEWVSAGQATGQTST